MSEFHSQSICINTAAVMTTQHQDIRYTTVHSHNNFPFIARPYLYSFIMLIYPNLLQVSTI